MQQSTMGGAVKSSTNNKSSVEGNAKSWEDICAETHDFTSPPMEPLSEWYILNLEGRILSLKILFVSQVSDSTVMWRGDRRQKFGIG